jgi:hypothetical protein
MAGPAGQAASWPALITGAQLLAYVAGASAPTSPDETTFADMVASAVSAAIVHEIGWTTDDPAPAAGVLDDLTSAAYIAGSERWKRREAPFGVAGFGADGSAVRITADDLAGVRVILARWTPGAGVGVG